MKVFNVRKNKDGSANITYDLTFDEIRMFKDMANKKKVKFDKKFINREILKALKEELTNRKGKKSK